MNHNQWLSELRRDESAQKRGNLHLRIAATVVQGNQNHFVQEMKALLDKLNHSQRDHSQRRV